MFGRDGQRAAGAADGQEGGRAATVQGWFGRASRSAQLSIKANGVPTLRTCGQAAPRCGADIARRRGAVMTSGSGQHS